MAVVDFNLWPPLHNVLRRPPTKQKFNDLVDSSVRYFGSWHVCILISQILVFKRFPTVPNSTIDRDRAF
jgi:hypothetical protein